MRRPYWGKMTWAILIWSVLIGTSKDGKSVGPISYPGSDLPRLPVSGPEERPVEIAVKPSRGNFAELPDLGIDGLSVTLTNRPCWSNIPSAAEGESWSSSLD